MTKYILLIILSLAWASSFLFSKVADQSIPPLLFVALRALIGFSFMLIACLALKKPLFSVWREPRKQVWIALSGAAIGYLWFCIAKSEMVLPAGVASLMPATSTVFAWGLCLLLRQKTFHLINAAGIVIAMFGVMMMIGFSTLLHRHSQLLSSLLLASGFLALSCNSILMNKVFTNEDFFVITCYSIMYATVFFVILCLFYTHPFHMVYSTSAVISIVGAGVISTGIGYVVFFWLAQNEGPVFTSFFGYLVPMFGLLLSALILHEKITLTQGIGGTLALLGMVLINKQASKKLNELNH